MNRATKTEMLAAADRERSPLGGRDRPRSRGGRQVLLLGQDDRCVLPPVLRGAHRPARERAVPRRPPRTPSRRASAPANAASRISPRWPSSTRPRWPSCADSSRTPSRCPASRQLANRAGLSAYHLHRVFKAVTGLTPKAYAAAHRAKRVRSELARRGTVTEAIYDAGYNSNGRFYEKSNEVLGMTPYELSRRWRQARRYASPWASAPSGPSSSRTASAAFAPFSWATIPTHWRASLQDRFPQSQPDRRRHGVRAARRESGGLRRSAESGTRPAARCPRHRVPAARLASTRGDPGRRRR